MDMQEIWGGGVPFSQMGHNSAYSSGVCLSADGPDGGNCHHCDSLRVDATNAGELVTVRPNIRTVSASHPTPPYPSPPSCPLLSSLPLSPCPSMPGSSTSQQRAGESHVLTSDIIIGGSPRTPITQKDTERTRKFSKHMPVRVIAFSPQTFCSP